MKSHTVVLGSVALVGTLALAGCHSSSNNKLLTANPDSVANFLYRAELAAMEKTHVYYSDGSIYVRCMQDPSHFNNAITGAKGAQQCKKVFKAMVAYAKTKKTFKDLSLSDLNNPLVVKRLSQKLQNLVMTEGQSDH